MGTCSPTDMDCICTSHEFQTSVTHCVTQNCTVIEALCMYCSDASLGHQILTGVVQPRRTAALPCAEHRFAIMDHPTKYFRM